MTASLEQGLMEVWFLLGTVVKVQTSGRAAFVKQEPWLSFQ